MFTIKKTSNYLGSKNVTYMSKKGFVPFIAKCNAVVFQEQMAECVRQAFVKSDPSSEYELLEIK